MPKPAGRTLYVIWGGANDTFAAMECDRAEAPLDLAAVSLKNIIDDLVQQGTVDLLIPNLPDLGMTPRIRAQGIQPMQEARRLTEYFNQAIEQAIGPLIRSTSVRLHWLDVWAMAEEARRDPASFGFTNITVPCNALADCEGHVFWDDIHPTTAAHASLGEAALDALSR
jgi:phospholipase/lecithinase/hemolysin